MASKVKDIIMETTDFAGLKAKFDCQEERINNLEASYDRLFDVVYDLQSQIRDLKEKSWTDT